MTTADASIGLGATPHSPGLLARPTLRFFGSECRACHGWTVAPTVGRAPNREGGGPGERAFYDGRGASRGLRRLRATSLSRVTGSFLWPVYGPHLSVVRLRPELRTHGDQVLLGPCGLNTPDRARCSSRDDGSRDCGYPTRSRRRPSNRGPKPTLRGFLGRIYTGRDPRTVQRFRTGRFT